MAIQNINLGTAPKGEGGDTLRSTAVKINENFSNATHAASRTVGTFDNQVPLSQDTLKAAFQRPTREDTSGTITTADIADFNTGTTNLVIGSAAVGLSGEPYWLIFTLASYGTNSQKIQLAFGNTYGNMAIRSKVSAWSVWRTIKSTLNTSVDGNGFLKGASPIVKVHADKVVLNDEAEQQNVTFKKNGIGDYTVTTKSGLSTDGWYIELPKDMNGNPKVAVTLSEVEGVITLKSYKRIFSMETFNFIPDLNTPLDIPTDRWIDIRLNEIPVEQPIMPSEPVAPYSEV